MTADQTLYRFDQLHIDVARNATDDFNPFHDPHRFCRVVHNPYGAPIALGFQIEFLLDFLLDRCRREAGEEELAGRHGLHFSNYEFKFADALRRGEAFRVEIKKTIDQTARGGGLSNRLALRKEDGRLVLLGSRSDTPEPKFLADADLSGLPPLATVADRSAVPDTPFFLKRKFLTTSNGKNFALGALADQHFYFDELDDRVHFPPVFTAALLSCALLEKAALEDYDFEGNPVVYTGHRISVDRRLQRKLRSNQRLDMLVDGPHPLEGADGAASIQRSYRCFGMLEGNRVLFRAQVQTAALQAILAGGS